MTRQLSNQTQQNPTTSPLSRGILQRKCVSCGQHTIAGGECGECQKKRMPLQRRSTNQAEPSEVPPIVGEVLRSPGQSLDPGTRAFMEPGFGQDFSRVRVHTDAKVAESGKVEPSEGYFRQSFAVQPKLSVGKPEDKYEQEADTLAAKVMSMAAPVSQQPIQREMASEQEEVQTNPLATSITPWVQQEAMLEEEEPLQTKPLLQRARDGSLSAGGNLESRLNSSEGGGSPLPDEVRSFMEPRFGADFSQVRVHTGSQAVQMNQDLNAQAFTHGRDIFFGEGKWPGNNELTAHELTHVVQQTSEGTSAKLLQLEGRPASTPTSTKTSSINPPQAGLSVSMEGLSFLPVEGSKFRGGSKARQAFEIMLYGLLGSQYNTDIVEECYSQFVSAGWGGLGTLAGDATEGEEITFFSMPLRESMQIIAWLENVKHLEVRLTSSQRDLLSYGMASSSAWNDINLPDIAREIELSFPQWYNETLFRQQLAGNIGLLRQYIDAVMAYRADRNSANRQLVINALIDITSQFEYTSAILEAIRSDSALISHEVYQLLWKSPQLEGAASGTPPPVPVMAPANQSPNPRIASQFLSFVHTQEGLATQSFTNSDSRRELMDRFGRFLERSSRSQPSEGDQRVTDTPATANTPPLPSRLSVSPPLLGPPGGAQFEASATADYRFFMNILFPDVFSKFTSYGFEWNYVRVPDEQIGQPGNVDELEPQEPSFGDVAARRFQRAGQYSVEDVQTLFSELGPVGIGATSLVAANAILRFVGTGIRLGFERLATPNNEKSIAFPGLGVYLVRSKAIPYQSEDAELLRPPSVAFQPVIVRNPVELVENRVQQDAALAERDFNRMEELRELLSQPASQLNGEELQQELDQLERALSSVGGSLEVQREQLVEYLRSLPEGSDDKQKVQQQLEHLDEIIALRGRRAEDRNLTVAESLTATFISDAGQSIRLSMEAFYESDTADSVTYCVSDLTTPNSSQDTGTGRDRPTAIMNAIQSILQGHAGYGRGYVSVHIDGQVHTRRIAASLGSLFNEALENVTLAISVAAVAAAPFTGGATLALLLPIGAVGAIPSAYRLIHRGIDDTLRFDLATATDILNIVGGLAGLAHAATPLRMVNVGRASMIVGLGADGMGMLLIPVGIVSQIAELKGLLPGERAARVMEILGQAMLNVGIMVGGAFAQRARQLHMETQGRTGTSESGELPSQRTESDVPSRSGSQHSEIPQDTTTASGVRIEGSTLDGNGRLKVTEKGRLVRCSSPCEELRILYERELAENSTLSIRINALENNLNNAGSTDFRTLRRLYSELQILDSDLQAAYHTRTFTLIPARTAFPGHDSQLLQIEAKLAHERRSDLAEVVNDIARLQTREGRIAGFEDWIKSTHPRAPDGVVDVTAELLEARRIVAEFADQPNTIVRIGQDHKTVGKSFDISVETSGAGGTPTTQRRIEVKHIKELEFPSHLMAGIVHGAVKINPKVVAGSAPLPTEAMEATVQINWPPFKPASTPDGDIHYSLDGSYTIPNPRNPGYTGNFFGDLLGRGGLNSGDVDNRIKFLSGINIIDQSGNLICRLRNSTPGRANWTLDYRRPNK